MKDLFHTCNTAEREMLLVYLFCEDTGQCLSGPNTSECLSWSLFGAVSPDTELLAATRDS